MNTCTIGDCKRNHLARGMCSSHYASWHRQTNGRRDTGYPITCLGCGERATATRPDGKYCSLLCRDFHRWGPRTCALPVQRTAKPRPEPFTPEARDCAWCGAQFMALRRTTAHCSPTCKVKAKRVRRRGRVAGSQTAYTWAEVMRLFLAFDRCCAYCEQPIDGQPDPDHVVPLSRGGSNSITNILPACRPCNSDKRDLLLSEWADDRARRGLEPRRTDWCTDLRAVHLTSVA